MQYLRHIYSLPRLRQVMHLTFTLDALSFSDSLGCCLVKVQIYDLSCLTHIILALVHCRSELLKIKVVDDVVLALKDLKVIVLSCE